MKWNNCFLAVGAAALLTGLSGPRDAAADIRARAFATHNIGKVGYFTTNIGQFYPYGGQFEKTLEFPINSGHVCMYRQCLMMGVPVNVISAADGRFEEFDAIPGFDAGNAEIAMSDKPDTWPPTGWPVVDESGNPVILSQQDSYCVYSDSTNWRYYNAKEADALLGLIVHQSIYSWGVPGADQFVIIRLEIKNNGQKPLSEMVLNFYSDLDIGGINNAELEWSDDCIGFDKSRELVYFYDSDSYSSEWGEANPFLSGVTFLETPNGGGITDWHWIDVTIDEVAVNSAHWDSVSYYLMRSDTTFFHDHPQLEVSDFFHLGEQPLNGTHFDDPATTRITDAQGNVVGGAMVAYICNGPFDIQPGETVEFWIGVMVGKDEADLLAVTDRMHEYYATGFDIPVVPVPDLEAEGADREVHLYWSNRLDVEYRNPASRDSSNDLDGYIVYRTTDPTLSSWTTLDTLDMMFKSETTVRQRAYTYRDSDVLNGFTYFYNLTAYRKTITGKLEESVRLADIGNIDSQSNAVAVEPVTQPGTSEEDLDRIRVVPNPYVISAQWDEARLGNSPFGEPIRNIAFTHLPSPCTIKIYTVDGDLIQTIEHTGQTGREEWNLLTSERRPIVSGIYFFHVESDIGEKVGRFAVIR